MSKLNKIKFHLKSNCKLNIKNTFFLSFYKLMVTLIIGSSIELLN